MGDLEKKDQDQPVSLTEQPKKGVRNIIIIVGIIILIAVAGIYFSGYFKPTSSNTQTWQKWGMSINYPTGLQALTNGLFEQEATINSGQVGWAWNQASTSLVLTWANTTSYDFEAAFVGVYNYLQSEYTNILLMDQGNMTMAGTTWQYQTYSYVDNGQTQYVAIVISYYAASTRAYNIVYVDTNSNVLSNLMTYGSTFTG